MTNDRPQDASLKEGLRRKQEAFAAFEAWREPLLLKARRALLTHALSAGTATADDVRAAVEVPHKKDPRFFGDVPSLLATAKIIHCVGRVRSSRPEAHGREIKVWAPVDNEVVLAWLRSHPNPDARSPGEQLPLFEENQGRACQ
jgi:hypothetical protein